MRGRDANRAVESGALLHAADQPVGGAKGRPVQALAARQVEVGLVNRHHLDHGRELAEDFRDSLRVFPVLFVPAAKEDGVRAELLRLLDGLRGVDPELARLVAGRRHHAAPVRVGPDDDGLALERGVLELFDGDEEGVHVDVKNPTD